MRNKESDKFIAKISKSKLFFQHAYLLVDFKQVNFDQIKKDEKEERQQIENEMIQMAQGMKEYACNFQTQFQHDQKVLHQIAGKQDTNIDKTNSELDKIRKTQ